MRKLTRSGLFAVTLVAAGVASAAGIPVQVDSFRFSNSQTSPTMTLSGAYSGVHGTVYAGEFNGLMNGVSFTTYCTELEVFAGWSNPKQYEVIGGVAQWGATKSNDLDRLFTNHYSAVVDVATSQAMQIAVWEILYETGAYNVASGNIAFSGNANTALAQTWLSNLGSLGSTYTHIDALVNPVGQAPGQQAQYQNFMVMTPVPEPEGYALAFAGLACIGLFGRKFREAKKA
ncbi:MAG: hypothetical protein M9915_07810 [Rhizobacter sp.]|nr:hypothetical protein [Rhizobacter sp.]